MTVLVSDSFNRADVTDGLGTTDSYLGGSTQSWVVTASPLGILSGQVYTTTNADKTALVDAGASDVSVQLTHVIWHSSSTPFWRATDKSNTYLMDTNTVYKRVAGSATAKGTISPTLKNGDIIKITVSGSTHTIFVNGVQKLTFTDTFNQTATKFGFNMFSTTSRIDDFSVSDFNTGGGTVLTLSLSDSITLGESFVKQRQGYISLVDSITTSESFAKRRQAYLSLTDGLTIGDTETSTRATINTLVRALSDSINMTDSITIRAMRYLTIFDLFSIVDSIGTTGGGNVAQTIKFKRGNEVDLPTLAEGEPAVTLDTNKMFVGTPNGNRQIATLLVVDSIAHLPVADKSKQFLISGVLGGTGTADALYVCKKLSNDTYDWVQFV